MRRRGVERLHATSEAYAQWVSKRKTSADPYVPEGQSAKDVFTSGEALGLVMSQQGEAALRVLAFESGGARSFPESLVKYGQARRQIAQAQEAYADRLETQYVARLNDALDVVKDYVGIRKKLESRRLALDAAQRKVRQSKKEDRRLDFEVDQAQERFEEIEQEAQERMRAVEQLDEELDEVLGALVNAECAYAEAYHRAMTDLRGKWSGSLGAGGDYLSTSSAAVPAASYRADSAAASSSGRPRSKSASVVSSVGGGAKGMLNRALPGAAGRSARSAFNSSRTTPTEEEDEPTAMGGASRKGSVGGGRDRSSSNASVGSAGGGAGGGKSKKFMPSLGSFGKRASSSSKLFSSPKEKYGSLDDDERGGAGALSSRIEADDSEDDVDGRGGGFGGAGRYRPTLNGRARSQSAVTTLSGLRLDHDEDDEDDGRSTPQQPPRRRAAAPPPATSMRRTMTDDIISRRQRRLVRAKFAYNAKAHDELDLEPGLVVEVTSEISEDWWIGEADNGDSGLFPSGYCEPYEELNGGAAASAPGVPALPARPRQLPPPVTAAPIHLHSDSHDDMTTTDDDDVELDQRVDEHHSLSPFKASIALSGTSGRTAPPPPPIRRNTSSYVQSGASSPARSNGGSMSTSTFSPPIGAHRMLVPPPQSSRLQASRSNSQEGSPFGGSDDDDSVPVVSATPDCRTCGCDE